MRPDPYEPEDDNATATYALDQAFPSDHEPGYYHAGLTKREWFAGMALNGMLANPEQPDDARPRVAAQYALGYADALIKALNDPDLS